MSFESEALELAIKKLLGGKHFSICKLDDIGKFLGVNPEHHPNYKMLQALHCVDYCDMSEDMRQELPRKIMECLRPQFSPELMAKALLIEGQQHTDIEDRYLLN